MENQRDNRFRLKPHEIVALKKMREANTRNVLVVGDLHEPFCKKGYLEFCQEQYDTWNCTDVVFIGDIIDNHYTSFHEIDIEAEYTGKEELEYAISKIAKWYRAFPEASVIIGNHDRMIMRKAQTSLYLLNG